MIPRKPRVSVPSWLVFVGGLAAFLAGAQDSSHAQRGSQTPTVSAPVQGQGRPGGPPPQDGCGGDGRTDGRGGDGRGGDGRGGPGRGGDWAFWRDDAIKKQIGLTDVTAARIYNFCLKVQRDQDSLGEALHKELGELNTLIQERKVDTEDLQIKVYGVESLRSKLSEARTMMLYRIDWMLTADQFAKLQAIRDQRVRGPRPPDWQWWKDDAKKIGLSDQASAEIDRIYQGRQKRLTALLAALQQAQTDVDAIRHARTAPAEQLEPKVVNLETLRSRLNESRTVMLYQFYQKLTPDQYTKLQQVADERFHGPGRRGGGGGGRGR